MVLSVREGLYEGEDTVRKGECMCVKMGGGGDSMWYSRFDRVYIKVRTMEKECMCVKMRSNRMCEKGLFIGYIDRLVLGVVVSKHD